MAAVEQISDKSLKLAITVVSDEIRRREERLANARQRGYTQKYIDSLHRNVRTQKGARDEIRSEIERRWVLGVAGPREALEDVLKAARKLAANIPTPLHSLQSQTTLHGQALQKALDRFDALNNV